MRTCSTITITVLCVMIVGCKGNSAERSSGIDKGKVNIGLINSFNDLAMQNAIISQHTLYPYHFTNNSSELNELGKRDISVLSWHLKENPGQLNVRKGNESEDIYTARVNGVLELLKLAEVDAERVTIADAMPGGTGMTSEKVLKVIENKDAETTKTSTGKYTTGGQ